MTIEDAIKKAIEGGYKTVCRNVADNSPSITKEKSIIHQVLLSPDFWQALGKALRWGKHDWVGVSAPSCDKCGIYKNGTNNVMGIYATTFGKPKVPKQCKGTNWKAKWHRLINHLAKGKDIESFFEPL